MSLECGVVGTIGADGNYPVGRVVTTDPRRVAELAEHGVWVRPWLQALMDQLATDLHQWGRG